MSRYGDEREVMEIHVARRIFVGNLAWSVSWQDLKDHFSSAGRVVYSDVLREAGPGSRSKGCGIVEFETADEAAAAIQSLHDTDLNGRKIWIREDREDFELRGDQAYRSGRNRNASRSRSPPRRSAGGGGGERTVGYSGGERGGYGGGGGYRDAPRRPPPRAGGGGGCRVFVANLSYQTSWQDLKDHFKQAGRLVHADILMRDDGKSHGAGVVEFEHPEDAQRAIATLHDSVLDGRPVLVREDREDRGGAPPPPRHGGAPPSRYDDGPPPPRHGGGGGGPGPSAAPGTAIVVHGLPYRTSWQDLKDMCRPAGSVVRADIATNPDGTSRGFGVVAFATPSDAQAAIELLNGTEMEGRPISAKLDPMQRYARAASQAMRRGFHSSSAAQSGGGADYEHRTNMYELWNMKNRKLKMGLGVGAVVSLGIAIPMVAVQLQFWKAKG
ncbi:RNA-binding domain-containing [Micractinium conductrix]|uniref:RNA-binding domain-containing n=1 Tax=Micractinium conductrix TaxID=554055 RepID=A0A2P6VRR2_9CHLO|nr:RNA-binding domain-containing [Micractinium conductrix]|eukprot:PSC76783.1 RNA-binding domain-containing [Micractinium conductrix]